LAIATLAVSLLINAAILRLCGYLFSFPRATWKKSLLTALSLWVLGTVTSILIYFVPASPWLIYVTGILLTYFVVRGMIGTTRGKSVLATLLWLVGSTAVALGIALSIREYLMEAFVVPTGALATTI